MKNIEGFIVDDDFELETYTTKAGIVLYIAGNFAGTNKASALMYYANDRVCEECGNSIKKFPHYWSKCDECKDREAWERYLEYPTVKYTGQQVFFDGELLDEDMLPDYLYNNIDNHYIFEAIPYKPREFDLRSWCEDIELDSVAEENKAINDLIQETVGGWLTEGFKRIEYDEEYYNAVKEARKKDSFTVIG